MVNNMYKVQLNCHDLQRKIILDPTSYNIVFSIICLKCCLLCSLQLHQMIERCKSVVHNCVLIFASDLFIYNVMANLKYLYIFKLFCNLSSAGACTTN